MVLGDPPQNPPWYGEPRWSAPGSTIQIPAATMAMDTPRIRTLRASHAPCATWTDFLRPCRRRTPRDRSMAVAHAKIHTNHRGSKGQCWVYTIFRGMCSFQEGRCSNRLFDRAEFRCFTAEFLSPRTRRITRPPPFSWFRTHPIHPRVCKMAASKSHDHHDQPTRGITIIILRLHA